MNWIVVAIVQLVVAWCAMRYIPVPGLTINNYYLVLSVLAGIVVWLVGLAFSSASEDSARPTMRHLGASVAMALLVAVFIQFERFLGLDSVLRILLPFYGGRPALIVLCSVAGYWAADDQKKLPFNPIILPSVVVGILCALLGALAGGALLHAIMPPGSYPRFLLAIPILAGGAIGLLLGAGLVVGAASLFRQRTPTA